MPIVLTAFAGSRARQLPHVLPHAHGPAVKPGTAYRDIGNVVQKHADSAGLSVVRAYCGHGIHSYVALRATYAAW